MNGLIDTSAALLPPGGGPNVNMEPPVEEAPPKLNAVFFSGSAVGVLAAGPKVNTDFLSCSVDSEGSAPPNRNDVFGGSLTSETTAEMGVDVVPNEKPPAALNNGLEASGTDGTGVV